MLLSHGASHRVGCRRDTGYCRHTFFVIPAQAGMKKEWGQQFELRRRETGYAEMAHLADAEQRTEGFRHLVCFHERIGSLDQPQVKVIGANFLQRMLGRGEDMRPAGVVMHDAVIRAIGR